MRDEPRFRRHRGRFLLFLAAAWVLAALGAELVVQGAFRLLPPNSPIRRLVYPSRFRLHRMARSVNDHRVATLIPDYRAVLTDDDYPANRPWPVAIDRNGFRSRPEQYEGKARVIAFVGDSVPFGWGIADRDSVPSQLYGLLQEHRLETVGVLNGAVPSYSLRQAVERFKREIAGRYPVVSVIVQALDPPMTFSLLGERWTASTSFHTRHREPQAPLLGGLEDYLDKSLVLSAALRLAYRALDGSNALPAPRFTDAAWRSFDAANTASLGELVHVARAGGARVVLLPVNPGPDPERTYLPRERAAIDHYNRFLQNFAAGHADVTFLDVTSYFEAHPRRAALFVDSCCHLSEDGARVQARYLFDALVADGVPTVSGS
jgi:hypothetical protein